jgi:hypothetical protein
MYLSNREIWVIYIYFGINISTSTNKSTRTCRAYMHWGLINLPGYMGLICFGDEYKYQGINMGQTSFRDQDCNTSRINIFSIRYWTTMGHTCFRDYNKEVYWAFMFWG